MGLLDSKLFYFFLLLAVAGIIFKSFRLLGVDYIYFLSYLLWFVAVGIFAIILPRKHDSIF
jgi:hypothetical protein